MSLSSIDHIIVVMLENRSFDNVLGALYPSSSTFEGVGNASLPNIWNTTNYFPTHGTDLTQPHPDPNEMFQFVYNQMFRQAIALGPNGSPLPPPPPPPTMQGFVADYACALANDGWSAAQILAQAPMIMNYFESTDVPIISALARAYGVCDHWFASAPTQTLCNRSFMYAGTSSGMVNNQWGKGLGTHFLINDTQTIFNLLEAKGVSWRIYYGGPLFLSNAFLTQRKLWPFALTRFSQMDQFYKDLQGDADAFPSYAFIEPNFIGNVFYGPENDEHPQAAPIEYEGPSNVQYGERLLRDIFTNLTANADLWSSTLLVILFDEHGGTFDHVSPPAATPPDGTVVTGDGGYGFLFDRYGVRVPAVVVSPWVAAGTISQTVYDHTSVLATVMNRFLGGVSNDLGARVSGATDLRALITDAQQSSVPTLPPVNTGADFDASTIADVPLTDFQREILIMGAMRMAEASPVAAVSLAAEELLTHGDAEPVISAMRDAETRMRG